MSPIKQNIIANFGGKAISALLSLVLVPLYIKFMGIEAYGLVSICSSLEAFSNLFDMGMSATMNRELARLSVMPDKAHEMRCTVRTLEIIYWSIAIFVGLAVVSLARLIAYYWIKGVDLSPVAVQQAIMIMGGVIAFRWPLTFYSGGLHGLQKQVLLNGIDVGIAILRGLGAVLILWKISPTIQAFFTWQIFTEMIHSFMMAVFLWRNLPKSGHRPHFQKKSLHRVWRFAAGMSGISITSIILIQMDKVILSKVLPLKMFGYYTLASVMASTLYKFITPISNAVFPRFSQLVSLHDQDRLKELYHKGCQFMSVMILPAAIVVSLFSSELLLLWTGNPGIAANAHSILSLLIIGTALNGLMNLPYDLQIANAWTKLALYTNIIASVVFVPMIYFLATHYGAAGAASTWVILNTAYAFICIPIMHSRLLKGEQWRWYLSDVGMPLLAALCIASLWRLFAPNGLSRYMMFIHLVGVSITTLFTSAIFASFTRSWIIQRVIKLNKMYYGGASIAG
ncbi:MAG: oligosaccharide flippase family protein [bacterium]